MAETYVASVKGSRGILPRGYPWAALPWCAVVGLVYAYAAFKEPSWWGIAGGMVFFGCGVAQVLVLWNVKFQVFRADPEGIRLGWRRHVVTLRWQDVHEIRISPWADGAVADILLLPSASFVPRRLSPVAQVLLAAGLPQSWAYLKSPLLTPLSDPTRYSVPLSGTTTDEVAEALRPLTPDSVPILNAGFRISDQG